MLFLISLDFAVVLVHSSNADGDCKKAEQSDMFIFSGNSWIDYCEEIKDFLFGTVYNENRDAMEGNVFVFDEIFRRRTIFCLYSPVLEI